MLLDLNDKLVSAGGVQFIDANKNELYLAGVLANALESMEPGGEIPARKAWSWAKELHAAGALNLDSSDLDLLSKFVEKQPVSLAGPVLEKISAAKLS